MSLEWPLVAALALVHAMIAQGNRAVLLFASGSFYGHENPVNLGAQAEAQRTVPGAPLLPKLPRNPYAIAARQAVEHSVLHRPHRPRNLP